MRPIPKVLEEHIISSPLQFKLFLIFTHDAFSKHSQFITDEHYNALSKLLNAFFQTNLTFATEDKTLLVISQLFKKFPDHFKEIKNSIYHTALVHTYALHKTLINNSQNRHKATNQLSEEEVAKQLELRRITYLVAEKNNFRFDPNYSAPPQSNCGLDTSQPISIETLSLLIKKNKRLVELTNFQ